MSRILLNVLAALSSPLRVPAHFDLPSSTQAVIRLATMSLNPRSALQRSPASYSLLPDLASPDPSPYGSLAALRLHAGYIRDTLPSLLSASAPHLPPQELYLLTTILAKISTYQPMTLDLIRQSRISKALSLIVADEHQEDDDTKLGKWPPDSVRQAKKILLRWTRSFGSLDDLRVDLFAPGGRLHGLVPTDSQKITYKSIVNRDEVIGKFWTLTLEPSEAKARREGHIHLSVGDWWINLASLFRDNGIGHPGRGCITWSNERAYAIVLCSVRTANAEADKTVHEESKVRDQPFDSGSEVKIQIRKRDKGLHKLLQTMVSGNESKNQVRLFRHSNAESKFKPRGGVRYDGLYRISNYSVHLAAPNSWTYTFTLLREPNQPTLTSVLHVPTSEQFDDWKDFLALKGNETDSGASRSPRRFSVADNMEKLERLVRSKTFLKSPVTSPLTHGERKLSRVETTESIGRLLDQVEGSPESDHDALPEEPRDSGYFSLPRPLSSDGRKALDAAGWDVRRKTWR